MNIGIDLSSIFIYLLFILVLGLIIYIINYIIRKNKKIKDIKINPFAPLFGLLFLIGLWLGDLTTLEFGSLGFSAMVGLNPASTSQVPAIFVWLISVLAMFYINYFYLKISARKQNKRLYPFNKLLVYTQLLGLIIFVLTGLGLGFFGHESTFLGFYTLTLYHSTLPLIILTLFILSLDIK